MENNYNVIGDIAGNYKTMLALIEQMPKDAKVLSLGDPNDRGPDSKNVIDYLMNNADMVYSNHAHMMVEAWKQIMTPGAYPEYYQNDIWPFHNGGLRTVQSYTDLSGWNNRVAAEIPESHIRFLENSPLFIETKDFIMTHAPIHVMLSPLEASNIGSGFCTYPYNDKASEDSVLWNRQVPNRVNPKLNGKINVFGHNASDLVKIFTTEFPNGIKVSGQDTFNELLAKREQYPVYAIGLDTSSGNGLTGLHLPSMTIYHQIFIG